MEAAGVVEEVGSDVTEVRVGDRVCYAGTMCNIEFLRSTFAANICETNLFIFISLICCDNP